MTSDDSCTTEYVYYIRYLTRTKSDRPSRDFAARYNMLDENKRLLLKINFYSAPLTTVQNSVR